MPITRRHIVTAVSVLYLTGLTVVAAYALHNSHIYSLPIPDVLISLAMALPFLSGIALETLISYRNRLAAKGQLPTSRVFQIVITGFLIFESVLATLAGSHISPPGSLDCALRERWQHLFRNKDASSKDMAFPFPGQGRGGNACQVAYGRDRACLDPWRAAEQKVAIMLLVVPLAVFVWKIVILVTHSTSSPSWLPSSIRLPGENGEASGSGTRRRQAIEYRDNEAGTGQHEGEDDSVRAEINQLNRDSSLASQVEGGRTKGKNGLWNEHHERWQQEDA
ncbi:hypothetical protein LTR78_004981 [Recurvomyces mirabilis]|uniref:Uncharacterized protein n=1 Tax=Recurvomyces mirabilis TaxID=574656 RepID=A0AAE0WNN7_9PEZI|nr:hypothetical protein LTR78_004981 [Recurvomyces mirabilis]